ncbi:hypothetical protein VOLCADRAFT_103261 [Volvox carteri f. nagariensis]|uniref:Uncharacterized protein n=1 Tax=Volvox carteri f. nagariensis TaxID=3068 RepID=D8TKU9_VOLCA|nr:uncharacterized protein VOLCADRAFT_103261 [Volvox carteri f. nagariensis]EFJ51625.1 hypothetical protein VOLCADRAFT_103261 [Volvox carteri f. nagariensis]|eukprot:XP_002947035.1 hypothetical protein VOLCADRAFT_103261 [Volvox carteri f. nagariensis]
MTKFAWASAALLLVLVTSMPPSSTALNAIELAPAAQSIYGTDNIGVAKPFFDLSAKWIWYHTNGAGSGSNRTSSGQSIAPLFIKTITVSTAGGTQALLHIIPDDDANIYVNGFFIQSVNAGWTSGTYTNRPITINLVQGTNVLAISIRNSGGGPAALLASLTSMDGRTVLARTDKSWEVNLQLV